MTAPTPAGVGPTPAPARYHRYRLGVGVRVVRYPHALVGITHLRPSVPAAEPVRWPRAILEGLLVGAVGFAAVVGLLVLA